MVAALCLASAACHGQPSPRGVQVIKPAIFAPSRAATVRVAETVDRSKRLAPGSRARIARQVESRLERSGYVVDESAAVVISPSVTAVRVIGRQRIVCTVTVRVAPTAADGRETWDAGRTAVASGTATVFGAARDTTRAIEACAAAALDETVVRRVLPFLAT
jgi:hypothetical protein